MGKEGANSRSVARCRRGRSWRAGRAWRPLAFPTWVVPRWASSPCAPWTAVAGRLGETNDTPTEQGAEPNRRVKTTETTFRERRYVRTLSLSLSLFPFVACIRFWDLAQHQTYVRHSVPGFTRLALPRPASSYLATHFLPI